LAEAERSEEEEIVEEIISLHENDELSARQIANLIGLDTKEVKRVLAERAEQLAASAA
jgi:DNA-directed RNA polymerase subunit F